MIKSVITIPFGVPFAALHTCLHCSMYYAYITKQAESTEELAAKNQIYIRNMQN